MSDGQRRAVQLFVALAPPKLEVILLDEACADLDALVRDRVLPSVRATSATVLYATHVFDGLDDWPTHVCDVRGGRVAYVPAACSGVRSCSCRLREGVEVDASMAYRCDAVG